MRKVINILLIIRRICFDFYDFHEKDIFLGQSRKMTVAAGDEGRRNGGKKSGKKKNPPRPQTDFMFRQNEIHRETDGLLLPFFHRANRFPKNENRKLYLSVIIVLLISVRHNNEKTGQKIHPENFGVKQKRGRFFDEKFSRFNKRTFDD